MSTITSQWSAPDLGGAIFAQGQGNIEAVVFLDPSGETSEFLWAVNADFTDFWSSVAEGSASTQEQAKQEAATALIAYEVGQS